MNQGTSSQRYAGNYRTKLEHLLRVYEPGNESSATHLLETYAGMEHELVECYRLYYAGKGCFCVALSDSHKATGSPRVSYPGPLHLPTSAMGTYLQAKLQLTRGGAARIAKIEDVRGPTAAESPGRRRLAVVVPRRRSFSARRQHGSGLNYEDDDAELFQLQRLSRSSS